MTFSGNLEGICLGDVFQNILGNRLTGTLTVSMAAGKRFIYFDNGLVTRFSFGVKKGLAIGPHLVQRQLITEDELERARKRKKKQGCTLRNALSALDLLSPEDFTNAASDLVQEQLYDLVSLKHAEFVFDEGKPPPNTFDREQTKAGIAVDPSIILMEGARREDEFSRIHQVVRDDRDIFTVNEGWETADLDEAQRTVGEFMDGRTEVRAILASVPYSRFQVLKAISDMVRLDLARPLSRRELEQRAQEALDSGESHDAIALLERALIIERSNTELRTKLAELLEQTGRLDEASAEWAVLGYQEAQGSDPEQAIEFYRRASELKPEDIGIHEKQVELMANHGHEDHAKELLTLSGKFVAAGLPGKARSILENARDQLKGPDKIELECKIAEIHDQLGNADEAAKIYRALAKQSAKDEEAQLDFLKRASDLQPKDEALRTQIADMESGRARRRRQRRRMILRIAIGTATLIVLGTMGIVELIASHQIISSMKHMLEGRAETTLRDLRKVHESFRWTLSGQRAEQLENEVFQAERLRIEQRVTTGDPNKVIQDAETLRKSASDEDGRRQLDAILARARRVLKVRGLFERINREKPDDDACKEYRGLGARELLPVHVALLAKGTNLWPEARRVLLEVLDRLDDPRSLAEVARTYVAIDEPKTSLLASRILSRAAIHRHAGHEIEWSDVYPDLEAARDRPDTRTRAKAALQWLRGDQD